MLSRRSQSKSLALRLLSANSFSNTWQQVDYSRHDPSDVQAPDPIAYLNGFDAVPQIQLYKEAVTKACDLKEGDVMLDVGCGTGTHIPEYSRLVGPSGRVHGIDTSQDMISRAQEVHASLANVSFQVADAYALPFPSKYYNVVKEDRLLQHLTRPLEAVHELLRVTKPGGLVVLSNPDFRSFQFDAMEQMYTGERQRPPPPLDFDLSFLTTKLLNGVIPTLCRHPSVGLSLPPLLRQAGATNVEVQIVPVPLIGRQNMEAIVPISYMARLSWKNGAVSLDEVDLWLERLKWQEEEGTGLFGVLNFYIGRGVKPGGEENRLHPIIGTTLYQQEPPPKPKEDVRVRLVTCKDSAELVEEAMNLINNEYGLSDTGITLSSHRLRPKDIEKMVRHEELMIAQDEDTGELVGCIQVEMKDSDDVGGLPDFGNDGTGKIGEFTCLAVRSNISTTVSDVNTQQVRVQAVPAAAQTSKRGNGIGAALVRAAEAHCRQHGCSRMQLGILCPVESEPAYKQWLKEYYLSLGYTYHSTLFLDFEKDAFGNVVVDQLHEMYEVLHQLVPCKAILYYKQL